MTDQEYVFLPKTTAEINRQFPAKSNRSIRGEILRASLTGNVYCLARTVAFTAGGRAGLAAVQSVLALEFAEKGYDRAEIYLVGNSALVSR